MKDIVLKFINKHNLINKTVIIGFSGGFDSMCLLDILYQIKNDASIKLVACHFNHNWRGDESRQEQENCQKFCEERGIEFYAKTAPKKLKKSEAVARVIRYDFFEKAAKKYKADAIFTAHNKNDVAETLLYRVIKGTGIVGLKSIAENRENIYRPLLEVSRDDIEKYCKKNKLKPNVDSSNTDVKYKRNYIRHQLIPASMEINPNVVDALVSLSKVAQDESEIVGEYLSYVNSYIVEDDVIITPRFIPLSSSVKKRLIYDLLISLNVEYEFEKVNNLYEFIQENCTSKKGVKTSLTKGMWLYVSSRTIEVIIKKDKVDDEVNVRLIGCYDIGDYEFDISVYAGEDINSFPDDNSYSAYIGLRDVDLDFTLRTRLEGDVINPLGMTGSMKLKKYLISKSIPQHKKDDLILLCQGEEVLWVAGIGLSNKIQVEGTPTHKIVLRKKV